MRRPPRRFMVAVTTSWLLAGNMLLAACATQQRDATPSSSRDANATTDASDLDPTIRQAAMNAEATFKYADAAKHYANLLQKNPDDQDLVLAVARNLRYSGAPQQAAQVVNARIAKAGAQEVLLTELGKDYLAADQLNLAIPTLDQAHKLDPNNWEVLSALGVAFDYQGNYKQAEEAYQAAMKLAPNNPDLLNNYALSLAQAGQLDAAIATLQTAVNQPSAMAESRQNMALLLALKGDQDGANRLIRTDLPNDMAQNNIDYYRGLTTQ